MIRSWGHCTRSANTYEELAFTPNPLLLFRAVLAAILTARGERERAEYILQAWRDYQVCQLCSEWRKHVCWNVPRSFTLVGCFPREDHASNRCALHTGHFP